jgi:hypothetical protein
MYPVYQDFPEDPPYHRCPNCDEVVYEGLMKRHLMKDHDEQIAAIAQANGISYLEVFALVAD